MSEPNVRPSAVHDQPGSAAFRGFRTEEVGLAGDSLVEEDGFEPPVPLGSNTSVSDWFCQLEGWKKPVQKSPPS